MTAAHLSSRRDAPPVHYPESDGQPMAENTLQYRWIVTIVGGLDRMLPDDFVAGDLLWYPVEGDPKTRAAPDAMVALGRPKGDRGSYRQWEEGGVAPQVVFEVWSPGNTLRDFERKRSFYQQHGVDEYYLWDPDRRDLLGWVREGAHFHEIIEMDGWVSPRLGLRFGRTADGDLQLFDPEGRLFRTYAELAAEADALREAAEEQRKAAEEQRKAAEEQRKAAEEQRQRADSAEVELAALRAQLAALRAQG
jgi:Uma2 family endonuclease